MWTGGQGLKIENEKKINPIYFIIRKCRHVDKKLSFYFIFSFLLVPFKISVKSVDRWTRSCLSISCFLSFLYPFIFCKKCGQVGKVWKLRMKKKSIPYILLLESVDMWTRSCLSISFFLSFLYLLKYLQIVWTGGQEAVFLFQVFFLSCTLSILCKKCGQVDKVWKFRKKKMWTCKQESFFLYYFFLVPTIPDIHTPWRPIQRAGIR